jgi:FkbM family methyltransferase
MGWRGLYFEPHPIYYKEALERHAHNLDRVKIVNVGLGDVDETKNLFAGDTFLEDVHKHYDKLGWLDNDRVHGTNYKAQYGKPMCKIVNVRQALEDHACAAQFDILSIDVEGYEKKIVSSYDFEKHRPTLVVIELRTINPSFCSPGTGARLVSDGHEVGEIMKSNDYVIIHQDAANTWFGDIRSPHVPRQDPK